MKVLIACEESQRVCEAFRYRGHEAYSCDVLPTSGYAWKWHIQDDVLNHLNEGWDLMVGHPTCRYLCNSGVRWLYNTDGTPNTERWILKERATDFFYALWDAKIPKICIENPIPHKYSDLPKYTQIIHPWMFGKYGENESKATCLWLKGLPKLIPENPLPKPHNQSIWKMAPGPHRERERSKTFVGVATAMASQWG